ARGSDRPENEASPDENGSFMGYVDRYHEYLEERVNQPAVWFDGFFGDPRTDEYELPSSFVRLRVSARYTEGEGFEFPVRLRANVKLPRASRKLRLVIVGENQEEIESTAADDLSRSIGEESGAQRTSVGLRYTIYRRLRSNLHFGGGTNSLSPFEYYLRVSYRRFLHIGADNIIRFRQTGFWNSRDGFGETSRFDLEKALPRKMTGRVSLYGTHSEISRGVDWGLESSVFKQLSAKTAASLDLGAYGVTRPHFDQTNYLIGLRTRANVLRPWLFLEIRPQVSFPLSETGKRSAVGTIILMMEIQFSGDD
ncbi:MAG: hypothetical protein RQ753_08780, partial [Desulfurivibrionaceae bacterium]|nr:hypothetical protein [Desulfurivibrionaceae bacterium]